jgi:nucleotide-binding universal stress UspA family protein
MRMRLLCATDLAPRSDEAVRRAALLAQQLDADVLFLHAVHEAQSGRVLRMRMNRAQLRLLSQSERAMRHAPAAGHISVRLSHPVQAIAAAVREWNPDLLVMAAPTRRRFDLLIGTTAERVIRATQRPLLLVGRPADQRYERLLIATDLSQNSVRAAQSVVEMGLLERASAWVVHGFDPPYHGLSDRRGAFDDEAAARRRQWSEMMGRELAEHVRDAGVDRTRVQIVVEAAGPLTAIQNALERAQPQLLVIGVSRWVTLKRLLLGSVADQVFRSVSCDILAIPPRQNRESWLRAA